MQHESDSLNAQNIGFDEEVGLMVGRPIEDPKELARILKIRQLYVDAGLMEPLVPPATPEAPKDEPKTD
jgi:hypothetical protein